MKQVEIITKSGTVLARGKRDVNLAIIYVDCENRDRMTYRDDALALLGLTIREVTPQVPIVFEGVLYNKDGCENHDFAKILSNLLNLKRYRCTIEEIE